MIQPTLENSLTVSLKVNQNFTYNLAILFLGVCIRKMKTHVYTETFTQTFIAELFIIAKN